MESVQEGKRYLIWLQGACALQMLWVALQIGLGAAGLLNKVTAFQCWMLGGLPSIASLTILTKTLLTRNPLGGGERWVCYALYFGYFVASPLVVGLGDWPNGGWMWRVLLANFVAAVGCLTALLVYDVANQKTVAPPPELIDLTEFDAEADWDEQK